MDFGFVLPVTLLFIALAVVCFWLSARRRRQAKQVSESGVAAEATITQRTKNTLARSGTIYAVTFRFDVLKPDGSSESYTQVQEVSIEHYNYLVEGTKVPIRYLPADPKGTAQLGATYTDSSSSDSMRAAGLGFVVAAVLVVVLGAKTTVQNIQATNDVLSEFTAVRAAIEPHIAQWEAVKDQAVHNIPLTSLSLNGNVSSDTYYGYCPDGTFYVYTNYGDSQASFIAGTEFLIFDAYTYTSKPDDTCSPPYWTVVKEHIELGDGWYLSKVAMLLSTPTPPP